MKDYLTSFRIPIEKIPEAKGWKIGGKYQLNANVEQVGINKERDYDGEDMGIPSSKHRKEPKYKTMVEFKVYNVSAKERALKKSKY